jgi:hypothetical protein
VSKAVQDPKYLPELPICDVEEESAPIAIKPDNVPKVTAKQYFASLVRIIF